LALILLKIILAQLMLDTLIRSRWMWFVVRRITCSRYNIFDR